MPKHTFETFKAKNGRRIAVIKSPLPTFRRGAFCLLTDVRQMLWKGKVIRDAEGKPVKTCRRISYEVMADSKREARSIAALASTQRVLQWKHDQGEAHGRAQASLAMERQKRKLLDDNRQAAADAKEERQDDDDNVVLLLYEEVRQQNPRVTSIPEFGKLVSQIWRTRDPRQKPSKTANAVNARLYRLRRNRKI